MTDERARVEALAQEIIDLTGSWFGGAYPSWTPEYLASVIADKILAYGAAQRAEEREACANIVEQYPGSTFTTFSQIAGAIRARREGPG